MPTTYGPEAIKLCRQYYVQFGGNAELIEKAMRKDYPGWGKQNLFDKGNRLGWIKKHGFEKSLELDLNTKINAVESDDERRYNAVVKLADHYQELALQGDEKAVPMFIKLTDQQIALRSKLDLSGATFETFVEAFEQIVAWAKEIDVELAKLFYRRKDDFIERAVTKYGKRDI